MNTDFQTYKGAFNDANGNFVLRDLIENKLIVKIKYLNEKAKCPKYAHESDAGMDLTATSVEYNPVLGWIYGTGIAVEIPKGYVGLIFPRSSNRKTNAYMCNHVGVVDSGYRGELMETFKNRDNDDTSMPYNIGDKIGQLIVIPYPKVTFVEVDELNESDRGTNGHGSTGK